MDHTSRLVAGGRWPADLDLWHVCIPAALGERDWACLEAAERARAARYRQPGDRVRFALTRARLRQLLAGRLGVAPAALRFAYNPWGRPQLVGGGLSFNVSHCAGHALIAISAARRVGVDVEWVDPALDWQGLTGMVCTATEARAILAGPRARQRQRFFHCWTAKEALLKAGGQGIGIGSGLHALCLGSAGAAGEAGGSRRVAGRALHYRWLDDIPGYSACLAYGETGSAAED